MSSACYLHIAIASPLRQHFDYLPPKGATNTNYPVGSRIEVPFGRRTVIGILLNVSDHSDVPAEKLRPALKILDSEPLLSKEIMSLLHWASDYYHHPIGDVMQHALPVLLRQGKAAKARTEAIWQLSPAGQSADLTELKRAPKQAALLQQLQNNSEASFNKEDFNQQHSHWRAPLAALVKRGWVDERQQRGLLIQNTDSDSAPDLNEEQLAAIATTTADSDHFQSYLLDGVTGSGKTEVYLGIIKHVLSQGRQALVLVPEISLTPQTVSRFQRRFQVPIAVMHSGLGQAERLDAWLAACNGEAQIVIGTRSALFTPMAKLGAIIIDEEHDNSFKQQKGFRYHARDLAVLRARQLDIPIILGSATPSLESLVNVEQGRYQQLILSRRTSKATPPPIRTIDLRRQPIESGLSRTLIENITEHLARDEQVLLFLNRRGYAPTLCCHDCGWIADCPRCDAKLTLHAASQRLRCHHCTTEQSMPANCPECGSSELRALGQGTERIESTLETLFPNIDIVRVDRDTPRRKDAMQTMLD
ncbi:MAG: primosomal protein N', partial [Gammaproteobacteria bacterium]|nr:primosomal protein N' [Gammaproteobacteria bacterium]